MRATFYAVILSVFVVSLSIANEDIAQESTLKDSINQFSTGFYKEIVALNPRDNAICSPLSAQIALGLLSLGARGDTQTELNSALHLPNSDFAASAFKPAIAGLQDVKGITLDIANKIYVSDGPGYSLATDFQKKAVDIFQSEIENINFIESAKAASTINAWVESKTDSKIKDLINPTVLGAATSIVLVNAIYFKGTWNTKFNESLTKKREFFLNTNNSIKVEMMSHEEKYSHNDVPSLNARVLEMPYSGNEASMILILPNEIDGLSKLEEKLATVNLKELIFDTMPKEKDPVKLAIPKFKIETEMTLTSVLPNLGVNLIFNRSKGDLTGIFSSNRQVSVSEVIQKAFIEVNEEGTTAAAATANTLRTQIIMVDFTVDRPFAFVIKKVTGEILFMGRYGARI